MDNRSLIITKTFRVQAVRSQQNKRRRVRKMDRKFK
jgi:hypothetical protein